MSAVTPSLINIHTASARAAARSLLLIAQVHRMDENVPPGNTDSKYRHPQPYLLSVEALEYFLHEKALTTSSYATSSGASRSSEDLVYLVAGDAEDGETLELSVTRDAHLSRNKRNLNYIYRTGT
jgi:hypothetical protein